MSRDDVHSLATSLLRTEAEQRAGLLSVHEVEVSLDLRHPETFTSTSRISFSCSDPGASTFVDLHGVELHEVVLNGRRIEPQWEHGRITLDGLAEHNELLVSALMAYSSDGEGLHRHVDAADGEAYCYAMSFLDAAPRWFACFDQPDLKARHRFHVQTPVHWIVRGNTRASQPEPGLWHTLPSEPLSTYYVTLVAGPWAEHTDTFTGPRGEVPLALLARQSLAAELSRDADDIFAVTKAAMVAYQELFGSGYPFGDYVQAFVPDFNAGAMENPGCVTFREQFLHRGTATRAQRASRAGVIAHEMAHQWFGDLVTMRWWDDLWLNESFAEYMGHRISTEACGYELWTEFGTARKQWGRTADLAPSTHPVAGNGAADARGALANFDGISYAKGASVLRQLAAWMGDEKFFAGLRSHFEQHRFGNATMADLMDAWRAQGLPGLDAWAERWLTTTGLDLVGAEAGDDGMLALVRDGSRPHTLDVVAHPAGDGSSWSLGWASGVQLDEPRVELPLPAVAGSLVVPDAGDAAWARVRPLLVGAADPWDFAFSTLPETSQRVVCWAGARDAVRCAELDPARALALVLAQLPGEADDLLVASLAGWATQLCGPWSPVGERAERRARLAEVLGQMLVAADAGSDRSLVLWRCLLAVSDDMGLLAGALDGRLVLPGGEPSPGKPGPDLAALMGPDERWAAVQRIVTLGGDPGVIDAELRRDGSSAGQLHAATARACQPTLEAKQQAMRVLLEPGDASAYLVNANAQGIFLPEQHELTAPLVAPWLEGIAGTAAFRQGWALAGPVRAGFPFSHADPDTLRLARQVVERPRLDPALGRALGDATSQLAEVVAALERWRTLPAES